MTGDLAAPYAERLYAKKFPGHFRVAHDGGLALCSCGEESITPMSPSEEAQWHRAHKVRLTADLDRHIAEYRPAAKAAPFPGSLGSLAIRRYWMFVIDAPGEACWGWGGPISESTPGIAYGQLSVPGRSPMYAHRISYLIHHGEIPNGLDVLHSCDNPPCSNPLHLRFGTHAENMAEMVSRGRSGRRIKGECKRGHRLEGDNVYIERTTQNRLCAVCRKMRRASRAARGTSA